MSTECKVCREEYTPGPREPLSLGCGHSFCRTCLGILEKRGVLKCPTCLVPHPHPPVSALTVNYDLLSEACNSSSVASFEDVPWWRQQAIRKNEEPHKGIPSIAKAIHVEQETAVEEHPSERYPYNPQIQTRYPYNPQIHTRSLSNLSSHPNVYNTKKDKILRFLSLGKNKQTSKQKHKLETDELNASQALPQPSNVRNNVFLRMDGQEQHLPQDEPQLPYFSTYSSMHSASTSGQKHNLRPSADLPPSAVRTTNLTIKKEETSAQKEHFEGQLAHRSTSARGGSVPSYNSSLMRWQSTFQEEPHEICLDYSLPIRRRDTQQTDDHRQPVADQVQWVPTTSSIAEVVDNLQERRDTQQTADHGQPVSNEVQRVPATPSLVEVADNLQERRDTQQRVDHRQPVSDEVQRDPAISPSLVEIHEKLQERRDRQQTAAHRQPVSDKVQWDPATSPSLVEVVDNLQEQVAKLTSLVKQQQQKQSQLQAQLNGLANQMAILKGSKVEEYSDKG